MSAVDTSAVRGELARVAAPAEAQTVFGLIERQKPAILRALGRNLDGDAERFARLVFTEIRRTPALLECSPESLLGSVMLAAQVGLEPGPLGHVYLVPFKRQVTFMLGYRGMIELAHRSGNLRDIVARTVYDGDGFEYSYGLRDKLDHRPARPQDRGNPLAYYGIARLRAGHVMTVLYPEEIEARRKRSLAARSGSGPWITDYDAMAHKTVIRAMASYLPMTAVAWRALERDEQPIVDIEGEVDEDAIVGAVEPDAAGVSGLANSETPEGVG